MSSTYDVITIDRKRLELSASGRMEDILRDAAGFEHDHQVRRVGPLREHRGGTGEPGADGDGLAVFQFAGGAADHQFHRAERHGSSGSGIGADGTARGCYSFLIRPTSATADFRPRPRILREHGPRDPCARSR